MGLWFSSLFSSLLGQKEVRILILGLDNAGKTTILCKWCGSMKWSQFCESNDIFPIADRLQVDEPVTTVPTIGFNVETLQYKNIKFQVWDLGGQSSIRPYWRCYYPHTDAVIFVIDSTDVERLDVTKAELFALLDVCIQMFQCDSLFFNKFRNAQILSLSFCAGRRFERCDPACDGQ